MEEILGEAKFQNRGRSKDMMHGYWIFDTFNLTACIMYFERSEILLMDYLDKIFDPHDPLLFVDVLHILSVAIHVRFDRHSLLLLA